MAGGAGKVELFSMLTDHLDSVPRSLGGFMVLCVWFLSSQLGWRPSEGTS